MNTNFHNIFIFSCCFSSNCILICNSNNSCTLSNSKGGLFTFSSNQVISTLSDSTFINSAIIIDNAIIQILGPISIQNSTITFTPTTSHIISSSSINISHSDIYFTKDDQFIQSDGCIYLENVTIHLDTISNPKDSFILMSSHCLYASNVTIASYTACNDYEAYQEDDEILIQCNSYFTMGGTDYTGLMTGLIIAAIVIVLIIAVVGFKMKQKKKSKEEMRLGISMKSVVN